MLYILRPRGTDRDGNRLGGIAQHLSSRDREFNEFRLRKDLLMSIRKKERIRPARLTLLALVDVDARSGIVRGTYRYTAVGTLPE